MKYGILASWFKNWQNLTCGYKILAFMKHIWLFCFIATMEHLFNLFALMCLSLSQILAAFFLSCSEDWQIELWDAMTGVTNFQRDPKWVGGNRCRSLCSHKPHISGICICQCDFMFLVGFPGRTAVLNGSKDCPGWLKWKSFLSSLQLDQV